MDTAARYGRVRHATLLSALALCTASARAATITVDSTGATLDRTRCTLGRAIVAANTNANVGGCLSGDPGHDTINFRFDRGECPGGPCIIELQSALPTVTEDLSIDGGSSRPTIRRVATTQFRILELGPVTASIRNVVIEGGDIQSVSGAILLSSTNLTLTGVTFTSNRASSDGGTIWVGPGETLRVIDSRFSANRGSEGGAISCSGGTLTVSGSRFEGNSADGDGGAIFAEQPTSGTTCRLTVTTSTFDGNTAGVGGIVPPSTGSGGGLAAHRAQVEILDSTFVRNLARAEYVGGGGIALLGLNTAAGRATVANVTVSANSTNGSGGGILVNNHIVNLFNVTVTGNLADRNGNDIGSGGGVHQSEPSALRLSLKVQSSIIAGNFDTPENAVNGTKHPDVSGRFESQGYNLIGTGDGSTGFTGDSHDQIGGGTQVIDALLGPLADNGGPTQTHAPLPGSPAIDKGNPDNPKRESACMETDQRGIRRPVDGDEDGVPVCDAGAVETAAASTTTTIVTNTTSTIDGSFPSTTTSTIAGTIGPCILAQLPDDSLAGVRCAAAVVRATLDGPPAASCTCKRCSLEPRLDKLTDLLAQAESVTREKGCRRKLKKARRVAKSLSAKVGSLAGRQCIAPVDRATSLGAETAELARRAAALAESAFCDGR